LQGVITMKVSVHRNLKPKARNLKQTALLVARKEIGVKGNDENLKYSAECRTKHNTKTDDKSFEYVAEPK